MNVKSATAGMIRPERIRTMAAPTPRRKGWAVLVLSLLAIVLFIYVLGPMGLRTATLRPMADFIDESGINANAYYYTEVEEFFEAERHMRESLRKH